MLKLAATRWLSMQHAVKRVLEYWTVLFNFFQVERIEENSKAADFIFNEFNNSCTKAFLLFLSYILNYFNTFNALFQGKKLLIHELSFQCKKLFKQVLSHYVKPEFINVFNINCKNPNIFLDLKAIDLGRECNAFVANLPEDIQTFIRKSCLEFYISAATDMQKRFPLTNSFFDSLKFLNPQIALSLVKPNDLTYLQIIWDQFKSIEGIDGDHIDREWKNIATDFSDDAQKREDLLTLSVEDFWNRLGKCKNFSDEYEYCHVVRLAKLCMCLPHSNAETERVFSIITDVKTKKRNKLGNEALNAISIIRTSSDNCCQSFCVSKDHLKLMASENLYHK